MKPPGSHRSTGSQVSEPSRWRQTTTAPSFAREKCTTGDADSKSASGILSNGTPRTMPAISVQSKPLRLSYQTRAATVVSDPISTFIEFNDKTIYGFAQVRVPDGFESANGPVAVVEDAQRPIFAKDMDVAPPVVRPRELENISLVLASHLGGNGTAGTTDYGTFR